MALKYVRSWIVYDVDSLAWRLLFRDEKSVWNMSDNNDAHLHILLTLEVPPKKISCIDFPSMHYSASSRPEFTRSTL